MDQRVIFFFISFFLDKQDAWQPIPTNSTQCDGAKSPVQLEADEVR